MNKVNKNIEDIYELSPMQQGMLFHTILEENSTNYFEQLSVTLGGTLNIEAFKFSWEKIIQRHSVLRTSFVYKKTEKMLQVVHKNFELPFLIFDFTNYNHEEQKIKINEYLIEDRQKGFELNKPLLLRLALIKLAEGRYKFIWSYHHLLLDGWSIPIIFQELFKFYQSIIKNKELKLETPIPYKNFIRYLQSKKEEQESAFWKNYLSGFYAKTPLMLDRLEETADLIPYKKKSVKLSESTSASLNQLARLNKITINSLLQAGWALILNKYSRNNDIVFGATFSGRSSDLLNAESMVGLFINTLPIRAIIDPNDKILDWIIKFSQSTNAIKNFEHSALYNIQKESEIPPKENLFDSLFVFENYPVDESLKENKFGFVFEEFSSFEETNYPLTIISAPGKEISIDAAFKTNDIDDFKVDLLLAHYKNLLEYIITYPKNKIYEIEYLTKEEREFLLPIKYFEPKLDEPFIVIRQFENVVKKYSNNVAIRYENSELTYDELNKRANKLANYLLEKNVGGENLIGLLVNRSFEMIISMLAVLKTGAGYIPIDPSYPKERVEYIISDAKPKLIIADKLLINKIDYPIDQIIYTNDFEVVTDKYPDSNLNTTIYPENIIYVIYTSGSTGKPKGTLLQNKSVYNFIRDFSNSININNNSRVLQFASISFDASVPEIYSPLLNGGSIQLTSTELLEDISRFGDFVIKNEVTTLLLPPTVLTTIPYINSPFLQTVLSAGEACSWEIAKKWSKNYRFINGYGPTEASVGCTWGTYSTEIKTKTVPIGIPIYNVKVYVLDNYLNPLPFGAPGELYVGEDALARGYLNKPDLTAAKFLPNPFSSKPGERIYKTNDLVKVLPDGQLEFLGRVDNQIKLRGFRIELEEIENALKKYNKIKDAAVIVNEKDIKKLVAFIIPKNNMEIKVDEIKKEISNQLPLFMIPSHFEVVEYLPLTPNKKIDRKKLQTYNLINKDYDDDLITDLNATEDLLLNIVKNVLNISTVRIQNNFFEIGGHSLSATQLVSRLREAFQIDLNIKTIFEKETLKELAEYIDFTKNNSSKSEKLSLKPVDRNIDIPLSFPQQRMWFLQKFDPKNISNNIFNSFTLTGNLKIEFLEKSINKIIQRHEILRTLYFEKEGKPFQQIINEAEFNLPINDFSNISKEEQKIRINHKSLELSNKIFNLNELPLFALNLIKLSENEFVLMFVIHHIIADGWSVNIFIKDLIYFYKKQLGKNIASLQELKIQYADFAHWQNNWLISDNYKQHLKYWTDKLNNIPSQIDLPLDKQRPKIQTFNGEHVEFELSERATKQFNELTKKLNITPFMLSLTAFKILLFKYTNQNTILVGSPIANRSIKETENLIGFFVNTLVIRTDFNDDDKVIDIIKQVRENTLQAFLFQDLPFEKLVDNLNPERDMSVSPIFQVAFIFQNTISEKLELPELNIKPNVYQNKISKYDLSLYIQIRDNKLFGTFEFNTDLFEVNSIKRMIEHYKNVMNQIIENTKSKISNISLLTNKELYEYIVSKSQKYSLLKTPVNIVAKFYKVVDVNRDKIAINYSYIDENTEFTDQYSYDELNRKSNQLANYLLKKGLRKENIIGISIDRSFDMITAILAVLKAGGAFLPIDPSYPIERIQYMCEDSDVSFIITNELYKSNFENNSLEIIAIENIKDQLDEYSDLNVNLSLESLNLAYVIYTSGSTGKPKGTMLAHAGVINLSEQQRLAFNIKNDSNILQFASASFDASVWEIFMALLNGATLTLTTKEIISSPNDLSKIINHNKISNITLPPTILKNLSLQDKSLFSSLKTIILAGEKCPQSLVNEWGVERQFVNAYGPTETTVCASIYNCNVDDKKDPPIGKAIGNFELHVLDPNMNPLPIGIPGELYIGGVGLARGYLKKPELTAIKFVPNPFSNIEGSRLYRSGDLVKLLDDGNIEFIGRIDSQIKLRGFRIELGEIVNKLNQHHNIKNSFVKIFNLNTNLTLVAYIELVQNSAISNSELKNYLGKFLPDYMIPTHYVIMERFPLTTSGKIDTNKLPTPDSDNSIIKNEYAAPRNELEAELCKIVENLLEVNRVGINDNFFDLGGHSLLATQFISRVKDKLGIEIPLRLVFEEPTILKLSGKINSNPIISTTENIPVQTRGENNLENLLEEIISSK